MGIFLTPVSLLLTSLLGMFCHFLKKNVKGETFTDIRNYFRDNVKTTIYATIVTVVTSLGLILSASSGTVIDLVAMFWMGWGWDSAINKWEDKNANGNSATPAP